MALAFLVLLFNIGAPRAALAADPDRITLYLYATPTAVDWSTPTRAASGELRNYLKFAGHPIGHANVQISCAGEPEYWAGATSVGSGFGRILEGEGGEYLLENERGYLLDQAEIRKELPAFYENGRLATLTYLIGPATCRRMLAYAHEYIARGYDRIYGGLLSRPRHGEGAGCIAYALSFLDIGGLLEPEKIALWSRRFRMPQKLMASPGHRAFPNLIEMAVFRPKTRWATENEPGLDLYFQDPTLVYDWVRSTFAETEGTSDSEVAGWIHDRESVGIVLDRSDIPTPTDSFWLTSSSS